MHRGTRRTTDQDGLAAWATVTAAVAAVVVVAGGAWAVTRGGDGSAEPGATPGTTPTVTVSSPTESTSATGGGGHDSGWPPACTDAARTASATGLAVMATAQLPSGWKVMSCDFSPGKLWSIDLDSPGGPFLLLQQKGSEADAVQRILGSHYTKGTTVTADGTGTWHVWNGPNGQVALTKGLSSSAVVLQAKQSAKALTVLANHLLTYEDAPAGNNGG